MTEAQQARRAFLANVTGFEAAIRNQVKERGTSHVWTRDYRPCDARVVEAQKALIAQLDALAETVERLQGVEKAARSLYEVGREEVVTCTRQLGQTVFLGFAPRFEAAHDALMAALTAPATGEGGG